MWSGAVGWRVAKSAHGQLGRVWKAGDDDPRHWLAQQAGLQLPRAGTGVMERFCVLQTALVRPPLLLAPLLLSSFFAGAMCSGKTTSSGVDTIQQSHGQEPKDDTTSPMWACRAHVSNEVALTADLIAGELQVQ